MKLTFRNTTANDVLLTLGDNSYTIKPSAEMSFDYDTDKVDFSLEPCTASKVRYISKSIGLIFFRHLKLKSAYSLNLTADELLIQLVSDVKKGKFGDEYERIVPFSNDVSFSAPQYTVRDENVVRQQFQKTKSNGSRTLLLFDLLDILGNCFTAFLIMLIPFILIWIFGTFVLAAKICGCIYLVICVIILILNRFLDKLKRALWKKGKAFVLRKQIFKNSESYFDNEYISSVFDPKPKTKKP